LSEVIIYDPDLQLIDDTMGPHHTAIATILKSLWHTHRFGNFADTWEIYTDGSFIKDDLYHIAKMGLVGSINRLILLSRTLSTNGLHPPTQNWRPFGRLY